MRVGVTCHMEFSMFSTGATNTAIAIAELMMSLGHDVTLLNLKGQETWWQDCTPLQKIFKVHRLESGHPDAPFDLLLEVGEYTVKPEVRKAISRAAVWVVRKPFVITEIEASIFGLRMAARDLTGIRESWLLHDSTSPDDVYTLETFTRAPVRIVPFVWTPIPAEATLRAAGLSTWKPDLSGGAIVHMCDTNKSSTSNCTISLVTMREARRRGLPIQSWVSYNAEQLPTSKFFRENILRHCTDLDISGNFCGRQRAVEWAARPNCVAMVHLRFLRLRAILLDLAWAGVPVVHNSPVFSELGHGAERLQFTDNSIDGAIQAFQNLFSDVASTTGWCAPDAATARRERLLQLWSPISPRVRGPWAAAVQGVCPAAPPKAAPVPAAPQPAANKTHFRIVFCDMADDWQPSYNFFTLALNAAGAAMTPPRIVTGHAEGAWTDDEAPDLVIFGPFGERWQRFPESVPKVHFTGERTGPINGPDIKLNIGFCHYNIIGKNDYLRMPLWILFINWFAADPDRLVNPKPLPLEFCTRTWDTTLEQRNKFCAFIVSNPTNPVRNQAFQWLSSYKHVDSAGMVFNNVGGELFAGRGGGGGERKKMRFLQSYRFVLAYENAASEGYTTEKYLHAKAAGCVPIYWGDPYFKHDFDVAGCIDARDFSTPEQLINAVRAVEENPDEWRRLARTPALDETRVDLTRRAISEMTRRIYTYMGLPAENLSQIPRFLGAAPGSPEARAGLSDWLVTPAAPVATTTDSPTNVPVPVTYATQNFLGCLQQWLVTLKAQTKVLPSLKPIVFFGPDVPATTRDALKTKFEFVQFEDVPTDWTPPDFPDFWEGAYYGWKLWICNEVCNRPALAGKTILWLDSGGMLVRWPTAWMQRAAASGMCLLEDPREENSRWCGDEFCKRLNVTQAELESQQVFAGTMCFVAGHPVATAFFKEAFELGKQKEILLGPRVSGNLDNGKLYGHRQDQSIVSILARRHRVELFPLDSVYCHHSMRRTFQTGAALYFHRGNFHKSIQFLPGIDDAYIINLDRRADRLEKLYASHPELKNQAFRWPATNGRDIQLTPELYRLFAPNDFFWKKSVMGCALSHLGLWWKLGSDHPDIQNYLIMEDDVKFKPGWEQVVKAAMLHAPEDYDVLYLGGILPPNREGFESLLEPVNKYFARIRPHQFFGQPKPTNYFHSCAYAYVLSRRAVFKIFEMLNAKGGYWTSADHILCSPCEYMNLYFMTPQMAGCFQDDDPVYANAEFNNFSRIDTFDSDLWNNDERFSPEEIDRARIAWKDAPYDAKPLAGTLFGQGHLSGPYTPAKPSIGITPPVPSVTVEKKKIPAACPARFLCLKRHALDFGNLFECNWLRDILGNLKTVNVEQVVAGAEPPTDCPIFILQRPHVEEATELLRTWSDAGVTFRILHLSDELTEPEHRDSLEAYTFRGCVSVLRTYIRNDFPAGTESKILVIPLGYKWSALQRSDTPMQKTPRLPFRHTVWSFFGTEWAGRRELLQPLVDAKLPNRHAFFANWKDPSGLEEKEYLDILLDSIFVPCPDGVNPETFRFYEALQAGCIPVVVKNHRNETWFRWVSEFIPVVPVSSWAEAPRVLMTLLSRPEMLENYRNQVLQGWQTWVETLRDQGLQWILNGGKAPETAAAS